MAMPRKSESKIAPPAQQGRAARAARHAGRAAKGGSPLSPSAAPLAAGGLLRTSPGLLAGHYAGCKFSEPPLPSALPPPPQRWVQAAGPLVAMPFLGVGASCQHQDFSHQLKVLLKVQA